MFSNVHSAAPDPEVEGTSWEDLPTHFRVAIDGIVGGDPAYVSPLEPWILFLVSKPQSLGRGGGGASLSSNSSFVDHEMVDVFP